MRSLTSLAAIAACATFLVAPLASGQQKTEITITRQPGILYLPSHVMEKQHLIEQQAEAIKAATFEAIAFIRKDTPVAVDIYKEITHDKMSKDEILDMLKQPGMMEWTAAPQGTMKFAAHLHKVGTLKTMPAKWTDYYLPITADLPGN